MNPKNVAPYNNALELNRHFSESADGGFSSEEFHRIFDTMKAVGSEKKQGETVKFFKTLPKSEVIRRAKLIAKLDQILQNVHTRGNDFQNK